MFGCDCHQIGGPWIAENPNCPKHGIAAQERVQQLDQLRAQIDTVTTVAEARDLMHKILDLIE